MGSPAGLLLVEIIDEECFEASLASLASLASFASLASTSPHLFSLSPVALAPRPSLLRE